MSDGELTEIARGTRVFDHGPVRGTLRVLETPLDVLDLMDTGAEGVIGMSCEA